MSHERFQECIDECNSCAAECNHCTISCLNEPEVQHMVKCIEMNLQCAAICRSASEMMSLGSDYSMQLCTICADVCDACATECQKHNMDHCQQCAEACRNCAAVCREMSMASA